MTKNKVIRIAAMVAACLIATGCAAPKVRIQPSENLHIAEQQTKLIAGLRRVEDARPESERATDEANDRPRDVVVSEQLYKNLKLSGLFQNVLYDRFKEDQVDVIIVPRLKSYTSFDVPNEKTAAAMGIALIPLVNIMYAAAGGPISDHTAKIDLELRVRRGGAEETILVEKNLSITKRLGETQAVRIGQLEGDVLADAMREVVSKTTVAVQ